eukprot:scaffold190075_cov32-Tisochrysis_lutea.AAC.3
MSKYASQSSYFWKLPPTQRTNRWPPPACRSWRAAPGGGVNMASRWRPSDVVISHCVHPRCTKRARAVARRQSCESSGTCSLRPPMICLLRERMSERRQVRSVRRGCETKSSSNPGASPGSWAGRTASPTTRVSTTRRDSIALCPPPPPTSRPRLS